MHSAERNRIDSVLRDYPNLDPTGLKSDLATLARLLRWVGYQQDFGDSPAALMNHLVFFGNAIDGLIKCHGLDDDPLSGGPEVAS